LAQIAYDDLYKIESGQKLLPLGKSVLVGGTRTPGSRIDIMGILVREWPGA